MPFRASRPVAPWICLAGVLCGFLAYVAWLHPVNFFGYSEDDTIYFSTAKALAEGRGYILPSFPGTPRATKYPVLLPWLLSRIWRINPSFPSNISLAVWVTPIFACGFFIAAFEFLRERQGLGDWPALLIVAFCAFHPYFLIFSAQVLSDMIFLAVALAAAMLADSALRRNGRIATALAAGLVAGLSVGLRTVGLAVVAGILVAGIYRRTWRQAAILALAASPLVLLALGPLFGDLRSIPAANPTAAEPGWAQTAAYATTYLKFWRLSVPNLASFRSVLWTNLQGFVMQPGSYLVAPLLPETAVRVAVTAVLSAVMFAGIVRQARAEEWKPVHFMFVFYTAMILPWDYPMMGRFLMLFLPLFLAGLWIEGKHFLEMLALGSRSGRSLTERILAGTLWLALAALAVTAVWNYGDGLRPQLAGISARRGALLPEKKEAYDWIREHTDPQTTVVAYEDEALYLYTGRQSVRPIEFSTESYYRHDTARAQRDLDHITDAAWHVRARYWMIAGDDYGLERMVPLPMIDARMAQLRSALPVVFRSRQGNVQIYDLACLLEPQKPECLAVAPALFPYASAR